MKRKILALIAGISLAFIPIVAYVCYVYCMPFAKETNTLKELGDATLAAATFAMIIMAIIFIQLLDPAGANKKQ